MTPPRPFVWRVKSPLLPQRRRPWMVIYPRCSPQFFRTWPEAYDYARLLAAKGGSL